MSSYRIVRIANFSHYKGAEEEMLKAHPSFDEMSYDEKQAALFKHRSIYSDAFSRTMRALGNEAFEIVYDFAPLQQTWAHEHGIATDAPDWRVRVALAQIEALRPDVLYFQDVHSIPYAVRRTLKDRFPFLRRIVVYKCFPGSFDELDDVDLLFAGTPRLVEQFRTAGCNVRLLYHGFDEGILEDLGVRPGEQPVRTHGLTFIGSSGFGCGTGHRSRYWALVELMMRTPLEAWVYESWGGIETHRNQGAWRGPVKSSIARLLKAGLRVLPCGRILSLAEKAEASGAAGGRKLAAVCREAVDENEDRIVERELLRLRHDPKPGRSRRVPVAPLARLFPDRVHPPVFGLSMYRLLVDSMIVFNRHTDAAEDCAGNMRLFDATGVGSCLLTNAAANMPDLFIEGEESVTYGSLDECVEKTVHLLQHPDEARRIALAGQERTLRDHTLKQRCLQIHDTILALLRSKT
ncbi:MAG: glycosyltransferase family 1 protein [Phycisphaerae bacterium]|nr:glycosyltransferase family 1 protein [Phycisphaerae bacterium]